MLYCVFFIICFTASVIGAICGIGGGVIIKPVLDAFGVLDVSAVSFLSGCTVLSMSTYSVIKGKLSNESNIDSKTSLPLGVGAAIGGVIGKILFEITASMTPDRNQVGAVQAICLIAVTLGTLTYTIYKNKIKTYQLTNLFVCLTIGFILGLISSFLGIGGGPMNLVVLFFFFSMSTKVAAENSLYIIFYSQIASLLQSIVTGRVPVFQIGILILMVIGGILGGFCGRKCNEKIKDEAVDKLFMALMVVIIFVNIYNIYKFI
jgi:uncharacterized membrane protein YfcA